MRNRILSVLLALAIVLSLIPMAAFTAAGGPTASASKSGNDVTITVKDGDENPNIVVAFAKNTTQTYSVGEYEVQVVYNGGGVKNVTIVGYPSLPGATATEPEPGPGPAPDTDGDNNAADPAPAPAPDPGSDNNTPGSGAPGSGANAPEPTPAPAPGTGGGIGANAPGPAPAPSPDQDEANAPDPGTGSGTNAPAPKPGVNLSFTASMTWNANDKAAIKGIKQTDKKDKEPVGSALTPVPSAKLDASGDKIPSNAHSGDYPGLYFYWNDQQKDDGWLKVDPAVFDLFKDGKFYITAKNSNAYWDYWILENDPNALTTSEGYLLYQIPRYFMYTEANNKNGKLTEVKDELKNINMIFIGGDYKDAYLIIGKEWFDEDGNPIIDEDLIAELTKALSFNNGQLKLGENTIKITHYSDAAFGYKLTVTEGAIKGYKAKINPIVVVVKWDDEDNGGIKSITFENQKQKAEITIKKIWDLLPGSKAPGATFRWGEGDAQTDEYNIAKAGDKILVKEGTYWFLELPIDGFTVREGEGFQVITVEAGGKYSVNFNNKEDRATVKPIKVWTGEELPPRVAATLTNGYAFGQTKTVKAGSHVFFSENAIADVIYDGYVYSFKFVSVAVEPAAPGADEGVNAVDFVAEKDGVYVVTFTNDVSRIPLPANVTVNKSWTGATGDLTAKELADLEASLTFGGYVLRAPVEIEAGAKVEITEFIPDWSVTKNGYRYTARFASVRINNGAASAKNEVDFAAVRNTKYTIVFTNEIVKEDVRASFNVSKNWVGDTQGQNLANLERQIAFDLRLGSYKLVAGTYSLSETLPGSPWTWLSTDGATRYTVTPEGVTVNGVAASGVTAEEKGVYNIVYTNRITAGDARGTLNVTKAWEGSLEGYTEAELNNRITFNPVLGLDQKVVAGRAISPSERLPASWLSADGATRYSIEQVSVTVNGAAVATNGSFTVAENGVYNIVFTNTLVPIDVRADFNVSKAWVGDTDGQDLAGLEKQISFDLGLGSYKLVAGRYNLTETFPISPWTWLSADGATRYTVWSEGVTVNGATVANGSVTAAEKGEYNIVYTNRITAADARGTLNVTKTWQGGLEGYTEAELNAKITFAPGLGSGQRVIAGTEINPAEQLPASWLSADGATRYSIDQVSVTVNGAAVATNGSFTVAENGVYNIVFTNKLVPSDVRADFVVSKAWVGDTQGLDLAGLERQIGFDLRLGSYKLVAGTYGLSETLPGNPWTWLSADGATRYTVTQEGITVNGVSAAAVTAVEDGKYTIVYTNRIKAEDVYGKLNVTKVWQGDLGGYTAAELNAKITFAPALGSDQLVIAGTVINPVETLPAQWTNADGSTVFTIEQVGATVNGSAAAAFTVAEKGVYNIVYTNKLVMVKLPTVKVVKVWVDPNGEPIEEKTLNAYFAKGLYQRFIDGDGVSRASGSSWIVPFNTAVSITEEYKTGLIRINDTPRLDIRADLMGVTINGEGAAVTDDTVSFIAKPNTDYEVVFTNRIISIAYPTTGTGLVYKGAEKYKDSLKDAFKDSADPKQYFDGGSDDTIYLYIDWYDDDGIKHTTEYWGHFKAGGSNIKYFYVYEPLLNGYFTFELDLGNRTTARGNLSSDHGRWYQSVVLNVNLIYLGFNDGPAPASA